MKKYNITLTKKQKAFIDATEDEVLFGGAAGGGKSFGQMADALLFALRYPTSKQLILRRTLPELEKSLIRTAMSLYPREIFTLQASSHTGRFKNGSIIDFGYLGQESDVYRYQSAEYDVVRFDELTHFTESQYLYLISRVRGANSFPKQVKSTTNPGGVGHAFVKKRFIDTSLDGTPYVSEEGLRRIFIPARLADNHFLTRGDPDYERRLLALPRSEREALLHGNWNIFEGQYFTEFSERLHVCAPFEIPVSYRKYRAIDYGLDRLVCLWIAVAPGGVCYVYRELCESNLPVSRAAEEILRRTPVGEEIYATLAPPDLWARSQESGRTKASLFSEYGLNFTRSSNDRECGWLSVKELLCERSDGSVGLRIFSTCSELIRCLPALQRDKIRPTDTANEPHDITHAPDALRAFAITYRGSFDEREPPSRRAVWTADMLEDFNNAGEGGRRYLIKKYGEPKEI
ncbi:MAG: terminase family protein [Clostridia bacterium]|nr:terminase family protein [Clostridia bacterium]